ncbi:MAG: mycothiol synthase [Marmoricola sp.]
MITEITADQFDTQVADSLREVAEAADQSDQVNTLNEQTCLALKHHGLDGARLWLASDDAGNATGLALLRGHDLDLVVRPDARQQGIGTELMTNVASAGARIEAWSHANHPGAARLADRFSVPLERELVVMSRRTALEVPPVEIPAGISIRTYHPGDEEEILRINSAAFKQHPEQGHMTLDDFRARTAEPWFDPNGLFLAVEDSGRILGFHWTKVHRDENPVYGEVYVVAVDTHAVGRGLGKVLTSVGLQHLATTGVEDVILYVEGDNEPALAVYYGQGFARLRSEVQYQGTPKA